MRNVLHFLPLAIGGFLFTTDALAEDLNLTCDGTTLVLSCGEDDAAGTCKTTSASDPTWNVTCKGHSLGGDHIRTICLNATEIGGVHVQQDFKLGDRDHALTQAVGTATGSSCELSQ